ncbi:GNAT family N-acetyltransferase [Streptomyces coffeae]|uniref:GNAT family N-acetyltransferase n=1 Tax=Streptomyces coffeae TaxID=621382 RepID=A0ABS1N6X5_9ACTN|nr:GNAT family N-acetyltransferase [Streptomyces coffeae]MBL1095826.1 GNAT family N-acetyltransferase [Streptomyces coffeae]
MDITVRRARDEELDEVGEMTAAVYLDDDLLDFGAEDPYLNDLRDARRRSAESEVLVATDSRGGTVLGTLAFAAYGAPYAQRARPGEGEFRMLAVRHEARRRGVAEALVRACMDKARELGLRGIVISSHPRMTTAHRLYGRLGFVRAPERDWEPVPGVAIWAFTVAL